MSAATRAKSAKSRATIAIRLLKRTKTWNEGGYGLGRSFDDCFEMNDGSQVKAFILERMASDPELVAAMTRHNVQIVT